MSQYWLTKKTKDGTRTALIGWDRPLRYFFCTIYEGDREKIDQSDPIYCNLDDRKNDRSLGYQLNMVKDYLKIETPYDIIQQLKDDQANNVGNKVVTVDLDAAQEMPAPVSGFVKVKDLVGKDLTGVVANINPPEHRKLVHEKDSIRTLTRAEYRNEKGQVWLYLSWIKEPCVSNWTDCGYSGWETSYHNGTEPHRAEPEVEILSGLDKLISQGVVL